jgi:hypothetical protein
VSYRVTITNDGSGPASGMGLLVALPPTFQFAATTKMAGNSSGPDCTARNPAAQLCPAPGALILYYGGRTLPARGPLGPGILTLTFNATCVKGAPGGRVSVTAQLTTAEGTVVSSGDTAEVTVIAPTPLPATPTPSASASPTPKKKK